MRKVLSLFFLIFFVFIHLNAQTLGRRTVNLNGAWDFEQTKTAIPPQQFTRKIPVPGLIHMANPSIDQYENLFVIDTESKGASGSPYATTYKPRYNWYRRVIQIPAEYKNSNAVLTILKSKYVTQVMVNVMDMGTSMACYTPVEFNVTRTLRFGADNEILIRVGDRAWLPAEAAGSTDKEKMNYLPGIWDDVYLSFTGNMRVHRALVLPLLQKQKVTVKLLIRNFYMQQIDYGDVMRDSCTVQISIFENKSDKPVTVPFKTKVLTKRDNLTRVEEDIPIKNAHLWSVDDPFLYRAEIVLLEKDKPSDFKNITFGMREFGHDGKYFTLNGEKMILRGTNITLHRFFEDPGCRELPWDREWVKELLIDIPKKLNWNAMRICVGIAPSFWYDIADEYGMLFQNEWLYWQNHGWDEQIRREYTDWVWSDGNHPSIAIWDAINENWDPFIGNALIPELKKLDPTRIWDAGYMTSEHMAQDEMDEPHPYRAAGWGQTLRQYADDQDRSPYPLGDIDNWPARYDKTLNSSASQLVNEYGWVWLWRDGRPAKLTHNQYDYFVGENAHSQQNREFQAYWLQLETEWLRAERSFAGVLAFCYLTNNYGHTGDWFYGNIRDLIPGRTLEWFRHCFAPAAVYIDLPDHRYIHNIKPFSPGGELLLNLVGVNDFGKQSGGVVTLRVLNNNGEEVSRQLLSVKIPGYGKAYFPAKVELPEKPGGYLLLAGYSVDGKSPVISRRYINVGINNKTVYYDLVPEPLK
ncbi:glycoside hydrolase family 2 [candidate division KSB1 bacterium]|nr:glycoside hydrolase family 2 [candidate division KSB1 bacterium]